jgi:hypothetical protein
MASIDASELYKLAADLGEVPDNAGPFIGKAIGITSLKIKRAWAEKVGSGINAALPYAIDYTVTGGAGKGGSVIESEIGFNKGRFAGELGNISEYGTPGRHPARGFGAAALHENEDDFEKGIDLAIEGALRAVNL